jgi:hypothetical protein
VTKKIQDRLNRAFDLRNATLQPHGSMRFAGSWGQGIMVKRPSHRVSHLGADVEQIFAFATASYSPQQLGCICPNVLVGSPFSRARVSVDFGGGCCGRWVVGIQFGL